MSQELYELPSSESSLPETNGLSQTDTLANKSLSPLSLLLSFVSSLAVNERQEESCMCLLQEETIKEMTIE